MTYDYGFTEEEVTNFTSGLQDGTYLAVISKQEDIENQEKGTLQVKMTFEVVEGVQKGRTISQGYFRKHPNETAQKIGRENLIKIAKALDIPKPDSNVFIGKEVLIHVRPQKNNPQYQEVFKVEAPNAVNTAKESKAASPFG